MENNGKIIGDAYNLLKKTFDAINCLKNDFASQLVDFDPTLTAFSEYSYGPKNLSIKANHSFLFKREIDEQGKGDLFEEKAIGLVCLFDNDPWELDKVSLKDEPEIWAMLIKAKNGKSEMINVKHVADILHKESRIDFLNGDLHTTGNVYLYHWKKDKTKEITEEWTAQVLGYPLVAISDSVQIREKMLKKLFDSKGA